MPDESGSVLRLTVAVGAERERVFTMLTDPDELRRWWGPHGFTLPGIELDLRVGGGFRFSMQPAAGDLFHLAGEYIEIEPPHRLGYSFRWEEPAPDDRPTVVTLVLDEREDATAVSLTQGVFSTEERLALHRAGWTESFERMSEAVEADSSG